MTKGGKKILGIFTKAGGDKLGAEVVGDELKALEAEYKATKAEAAAAKTAEAAPKAVTREFEKGSRISVPGLGDPLRGTSLKVGRKRLTELGFEELPQTASSGRVTFQKVEQVDGGKRIIQMHFDPNDVGGPNWHKYITDKHGQIYELNDRGYVEAFGTNNPIERVHIPGRQ